MKAKLTALLYKAGVLVTPEEKERLRKLTVQDRMLEQSVLQLLLALPLVVLLGFAYKGGVGALYALVGSVVVLVGLQVFQIVHRHQEGGKK
jgi:hypothetical protein